MDQQERPEIPADLARVHQLIWVQSAVGPILFGVGLFFTTTGSSGAAVVGMTGCAVLWLLAYAPLRTKARAIPLEVRVPAPDAPRWLVRTAGIGQLVCCVLIWFDPWSALIVPANMVAGAVIFMRIMACHGMDLPTERQGWGNLLFILLLGTLLNSVVAVNSFMICR